MIELSAALMRVPIVGILRGCPPEHTAAMADAAAGAGIVALEVTFDSLAPVEAIRMLCETRADLAVGAGTVCSATDVTLAVEAGARFIVSPVLDSDVVGAAAECGVAVVPGAATPTEIRRAVQLGAAMVKVFPARELGGPDFVRSVIGPLGGPRLLPTGGVDAANAAQFLEAGAAAVGIGGALFPPAALEAGDAAEVSRRAQQIVGAVT